jgi:hypothetical protein
VDARRRAEAERAKRAEEARLRAAAEAARKSAELAERKAAEDARRGMRERAKLSARQDSARAAELASRVEQRLSLLLPGRVSDASSTDQPLTSERAASLVDAAGDVAAGWLNDQTSPVQRVLARVVDAVLPADRDNSLFSRSSFLRQALASWASGQAASWLHEQSITAGTRQTGDPIEDQFARAFSAAQPRNTVFGLYDYMDRFSDEAVDAISRSFGFITGEEQ